MTAASQWHRHEPAARHHQSDRFTQHTGEDELLFPLLRERATLDPELMDRMDAQHAQVDDGAAISAELPAWTTSADAAAGERMAARIDATMPTLIDHLAEEEQKLLPIVSATLTQSDWDALGKHGMNAIPVTRRLVILGSRPSRSRHGRRTHVGVVPLLDLAYEEDMRGRDWTSRPRLVRVPSWRRP